MIKEIVIEHLIHKQEPRIFLRFIADNEASGLARNFLHARWSASQCAWHISYTPDYFEKISAIYYPYGVRLFQKNNPIEFLKIQPQDVHQPELKELTPEATEKTKGFVLWLKSRRYSQNTIATYTDALRTFFKYYHNKPISDISNDDLIAFNNNYILAHKLSASYQNQVVNAVKLFFRTVELKIMQPELIHRPKTIKLLPNVLSKEEIKLILNALGNVKHKAMLSLIYSCGLRRSELLSLKLTDIDSRRLLVIVRQSKGRKDRVAPLSEKILDLLRDYYKVYKPKLWLFEGQDKQSQYDESSLANVLKQAVEKSKINKPVTLHWLRHSYATHLLENGTDLRYIQEILGHSRSSTTEIYTHVSDLSIRKVVSPFDNL
ncbi:MAG: site-specific integrase [Bacteroidia bacterium]|nr:site-specific integrase [Bacteroidia bacterium]